MTHLLLDSEQTVGYIKLKSS